MQGQQAYIFGSFVIPEGAGPGQTRIEFDADNGTILVYDTTRLIASISPAIGVAPDGSMYVRGVASYGVPPTRIIISLDGAGALRFEADPADNPFTGVGLIAGVNPGVANPGNTGQLVLRAPTTNVANPDQAFQQMESRSNNSGQRAQTLYGFGSAAIPNTDGIHVFQGYQYGARWVGGPPAAFTREIWKPFPFAVGWATLAPTTCSYRLTPTGKVEFRGLAQKTTAGVPADGTVIGTLPAGYRPSQPELFVVACDNTTVKARVEIDATGDVAVYDMPNRFPSLIQLSYYEATVS